MSKDPWVSDAAPADTAPADAASVTAYAPAAELLPLHLCLLPSVPMQEKIASHAALWTQLPHETWTCPWRLHLTVLAGLGWDAGTRTAPWDVLEGRLLRRLQTLKFAPLQLELAQGMVWDGNVAMLLADENAALRKLRDTLLLMALESGLRPIKAMDTPHVTLSRSATHATCPPQDFAPVRWTASDVALVRSTPYPAWYEVVGRYGH